MLDLAISKGLIQKAQTNDPAQKGRFFFFRKLISDYLNKLKVPFYDECCPTLANNVPVSFNNGLQYFNGTTWTQMNVSTIPLNPPQSLTGNGVINITSYLTQWSTGSTPNTATLANGSVIGQLKKITIPNYDSNGVLTPLNLAGGTTITFTGNQTVLLIWNGTDWVVIENDGATIA